MRVLVIEDDKRLAEHVSNGFRKSGHVVYTSHDGRDGLFLATSGDYDIIILDRMLPNVDGMAILSSLRAGKIDIPIILASALGTVEDRVEGIRKGANDYLAKPFSLTELIVRAEGLTRKPEVSAQDMRLEIADLTLDLRSRHVMRAGNRIVLSPQEQRLLEYFMGNIDRVLTRSMILEHVWDYSFDPQTNIVDQHVSNLRQKIDKDYSQALIHTVRGFGYRMSADSD